MIKTVALEKIFRTEEVETLALNKVSIEVKEGEFVAIMGPSGRTSIPFPFISAQKNLTVSGIFRISPSIVTVFCP